MEPTIYKTGAYKTPDIYKGAGGIYKGRGVYNGGAAGDVVIYQTDFANFDYNTKTDIPLIGETTSYDNSGKTYFAGGVGNLIIDSDSSNTVATKGIQFNLDGKYIELVSNTKINHYTAANSLHFVWLNKFCYDFEKQNYGDKINILVSKGTSAEIFNGAYKIDEDSWGIWYAIPDSIPNVYSEYKIEFKKENNKYNAYCHLNGTLYVKVLDIPTNQKYFFDPRRLGTISSKDVTIIKHL